MTRHYRVLLNRLAHAVWAPLDQRYLLAISQRLYELSLREPSLLDAISLTADDLRSLPNLIAEASRESPEEHEKLALVAHDPISEAHIHHGKHPLAGVLDSMPGYTIALTKLPASSDHHDEFEHIITQILMALIQANLQRSEAEYRRSAAQLLMRELNARHVLKSEDQPPQTHNLHRLSLAARKCVSRLAHKPSTDWELHDQATWDKFLATANRYLKAPDRPPRPVQRGASKKHRRLTTAIYRSRSTATHIRSPLQLMALEHINPIALSEDHVLQRSYITIRHARRAMELDLSPYELIEEDAFEIGEELHEYHDELSARAASRYQGKQLENAAQLLCWATTNLTPATSYQLTQTLQSAAQELSARGLAATLLLASVVLGRPLEELVPNGLAIDANAQSVEAIAEDRDALAIILLRLSAIAIRVNLPPVKKQHDWAGAIRTAPYVLVPDYLELGAKLARFGNAIRAPGTLPSRQLRHTISAALTSLYRQLRSIEVSPNSMWQVLPRLMQSESGLSAGMAMLTAWQTKNSRIDLHYHTIPAQSLSSRYMAAMTELLGDDSPTFIEIERGLPSQNYYVGAPNTPSDKATLNLIKGFKKALTSSQSHIIRHHNLLTLYTLFVCTTGFGLRHAVDPAFSVHRFEKISWLSYVEKGQYRQLILPTLVDKQLQAYEAHLAQLKNRRLIKAILPSHQFFLLDETRSTKYRLLSPGKIGQELATYDIEFPLALNSYRKWMFSKLFEAGQRGIGTDFFGGHGVAGRLPLTETNSTTIDVYHELADTLDQILTQSGWEVLS